MVETSENKIEELFKLQKLLITRFTQALVEQNLGLDKSATFCCKTKCFQKIAIRFQHVTICYTQICNNDPNL